MPEAGLRERKKRETQRALSSVAQELVHARGLEQVTIEDIAAAAGVSVRTFFNYFSSKDEALVGIEPRILVELAEELRARPADEQPVAALKAVVLPEGDAAGALRRWQLRNELVRRHPSLLPRHLAATLEVETALAGALAERLRVDPARDPVPRAVVASVLAAIRSTLAWWDESDQSLPLPAAIDRALSHLSPNL